ncbi:MAG: metallophosphoesterase family protein [Clostridiales bacterium]|nr:metallophosphoesterase family protein [Clostridiales bacterium]
MRRKIVSLCLALVLVFPLIFSSKANAASIYDQTEIDANLNSSATPDHIVLSWTGDPTITQSITWRTIGTVETGEVQYREKGSSSFKEAVATKSPLTTIDADNPPKATVNIFRVTVTGLKPGTTYEYKVGSGQNFSEINTFKTEASNTNKFKFIVFGDSQSGNAAKPIYSPWHDTVQKAFAQNKDASFVISLGDLIEQGQSYQHWNNWFAAAKGVIDNIPEMPVQGNHETYVPNDGSTKPVYFINQFSVPSNGPYGFKGQTYSFNYGNTHFVVLDSQEDEEAPNDDSFLKAQAQWLDNDLAKNSQKWTIVSFHKTPYYIKKTRNNPAVKDIFTPIVEKHHVDIVLNGHDHGVARTYPINGGKYYTDYSKGTVYYVTGRSGNKSYTDLNKKVWDAAFIDAQDSPTYEVVDIDGGKLSIKSYKYNTSNYSTPTLIDTLTIDKDNPANSTALKINRSENTQLAIAGTLQEGYNVTVVNNKAYIDPALIAKYYGGTYDANSLKLTVNNKDYVYTKADLLNNDSSKVNLDAIYKSGIDASYNDAINTVLVDITGRVDATGFKGFTIGQVENNNPPSNNPPSNNQQNGNQQNNNQQDLPKTSSSSNAGLYVVLGILLLATGLCLNIKLKKRTN